MKSIAKLFLLFLLVQCTSNQKSGPGSLTDVGVWQGKVLMVNNVTKFKKWAYVIWASDSENNRMRVNVNAVFDQPVATFLKNKSTNDLWLFLEGKHFESNDGKKLFEYLTKLSLDPKIFYSLLGEPQSPGTEWQCVREKQEMSCRSETYKTQFRVDYGEVNSRTIVIEKDSNTLQLKLSRSKVQVKDSLFKPVSSSQFKTIKI